MKEGLIIAIDGTDGSGKATQTGLLVNRLRSEGEDVLTMSFPVYESPTGMLVGAYLGKKQCMTGIVREMCPGLDEQVLKTLHNHPIVRSVYAEGAVQVDPKVSCLGYAADRAYHAPRIRQHKDKGGIVVLDRYVNANKGHQGGKITNAQERSQFYRWLEELEFGLLRLPRPDIDILLYTPVEIALTLRQSRAGESDEHENNLDHLRQAQEAYLQLAKEYSLHLVECTDNGKMRDRTQISLEIFALVNSFRSSI